MLSPCLIKSVFQGADCPFIVCMTYAFVTQDRVCFVLDLMNGGDLHYHLTQHGCFSGILNLFNQYLIDITLHRAPSSILRSRGSVRFAAHARKAYCLS